MVLFTSINILSWLLKLSKISEMIFSTKLVKVPGKDLQNVTVSWVFFNLINVSQYFVSADRLKFELEVEWVELKW